MDAGGGIDAARGAGTLAGAALATAGAGSLDAPDDGGMGETSATPAAGVWSRSWEGGSESPAAMVPHSLALGAEA